MTKRILREVDLFPPVKAWLEGRGYTVYAERPCYASSIDVVGRKEVHLISIELKMSLTDGVILQASRDQVVADESYAAVPTRPRKESLERCRELGIGVFSIRNGAVRVVVEPGGKWGPSPAPHQQMLDNCTGEPGEMVGGLPCLKGMGPAQDCRRRVDKYLERHPGAPWKEVFIAVPNHYSSYQSMRSALTTGLARRAQLREMLKKNREGAKGVQ